MVAPSISTIALPRILRIGGGASRQLPELLATLGLSRPFLVSDAFLEQSGMLEPILSGLAAAGIAARVFTGTVPDPTSASIDAGLEALRGGEHDCVVGFGGGSAMDLAKLVAVLVTSELSLPDISGPNRAPARSVTLAQIPTTAGTGSEVGTRALVTDPATMNKPMIVAILFILVLYVTMVYGPIAALLVELFPTHIRYSSMSLPYHIGNGWFGGFLPTTAFAIVAATGNIYSGLWYPIIVAVGTVVLGFLLVKEGKDVDINA
mgnify:CR=1 FL=1